MFFKELDDLDDIVGLWVVLSESKVIMCVFNFYDLVMELVFIVELFDVVLVLLFVGW